MNTKSSHRLSNTGWIKLHRCLLEHPLWLNSTPQHQVILITLLLLANHAEKKWEWQGKPYTCKPGQLITSLKSLRKKCLSGITIQNIRSALKRFENMGFIVKQSDTHNTLITICNWELYQKDTTDTGIADVTQTSNIQPTPNTRSTTNKNVKN